ncbi:MAG: hypothetical protein ABSD74_16920 [Rhizomicrobium sp.]|jgi:hypothetical protein
MAFRTENAPTAQPAASAAAASATIAGMKSFAAALKGGDRRSIGRADNVVAAVRNEPERFEELWACLADADPLVRMRAADALEKLSREDAARFGKRKKELLSGRLDDGTAEVRWHPIAIEARLALTATDAAVLVRKCDHYLRHDDSRIVRVMALQAAHDVASRFPDLVKDLTAMLDFARAAPWSSLRARARKLDVRQQGEGK